MKWYWWVLIGVAVAVAFFWFGSMAKESSIKKDFTLVPKPESTPEKPADPASQIN